MATLTLGEHAITANRAVENGEYLGALESFAKIQSKLIQLSIDNKIAIYGKYIVPLIGDLTRYFEYLIAIDEHLAEEKPITASSPVVEQIVFCIFTSDQIMTDIQNYQAHYGFMIPLKDRPCMAVRIQMEKMIAGVVQKTQQTTQTQSKKELTRIITLLQRYAAGETADELLQDLHRKHSALVHEIAQCKYHMELISSMLADVPGRHISEKISYLKAFRK